MRKPELTTTAHPFTATELEWLESFKAAVAAGLYSEWDLGDELMPGGSSFPSNPPELTRLLNCRRAVAAGFYHED